MNRLLLFFINQMFLGLRIDLNKIIVVIDRREIMIGLAELLIKIDDRASQSGCSR